MSVFVDRDALRSFLVRLGFDFPHQGTLYLLGQTGLLFEGWVERAELVEIFSELDEPADASARRLLDERIAAAAADLGLEVIDESPADVIPLLAGHAKRVRGIGPLGDLIAEDSIAGDPIAEDSGGAGESGLRLAHFDPYSIAFRYIARGDEPDYHVALHLLERGWIDMDEMEHRLEALLPSFSLATIHQDPAEFRRKYHGMKQMWKAVRAGTTHRPTAV